MISGGGWEFFSSPPRPDRLWGLPSLLFNGYGGRDLSPAVKGPRREADHSHSSSANVKEYVALYLHPQYVFMPWCLVKYRDKFTLNLTFVNNEHINTDNMILYTSPYSARTGGSAKVCPVQTIILHVYFHYSFLLIGLI
jgi:hypothetical protein